MVTGLVDMDELRLEDVSVVKSSGDVVPFDLGRLRRDLEHKLRPELVEPTVERVVWVVTKSGAPTLRTASIRVLVEEILEGTSDADLVEIIHKDLGVVRDVLHPSLELSVTRLRSSVGDLTRFAIANREAQMPEFAERYRELTGLIVKTVVANSENPEVAEVEVKRRLKEAERHLYRPKDRANKDAIRRVKDASVELGFTACQVVRERGEIPVAVEDADDPLDVKPADFYLLEVNVKRVFCVTETAPKIGMDDISVVGNWEYAGNPGHFRRYYHEFDDEETGRDDHKPNPPHGHRLCRTTLISGKTTKWKGSVSFIEEDLMDNSTARFIADIIGALANLAARFGLGQAKAWANGQIEDMNLPSDIEAEAKEMVDEAIEEIGDAIEDEIKSSFSSFIADALGHDIFIPYPLYTAVAVDWKDVSQPPKWTPYIQRRAQSAQKKGADQVTSKRQRMTERVREGDDEDAGVYYLWLRYRVYAAGAAEGG